MSTPRQQLEYLANAAASVITISQAERFNEAMRDLSKLVIDREAQDAVAADKAKTAAEASK